MTFAVADASGKQTWRARTDHERAFLSSLMRSSWSGEMPNGSARRLAMGARGVVSRKKIQNGHKGRKRHDEYRQSATPVAEKPFDVGINEKLPFSQYVILAFQNMFGMTGMFVFPGMFGRAFHLPNEQIAYLYGMIFLVSGLITVFQGFGLLRLPIVQGPYVGSFIGLLVLGHHSGRRSGRGIRFVLRRLDDLGAAGNSDPRSEFRCAVRPVIPDAADQRRDGDAADDADRRGVAAELDRPSAHARLSRDQLMAGFVAVVIFIAHDAVGRSVVSSRRHPGRLGLGTDRYAGFIPISFQPVATAPWLVMPQISRSASACASMR